MDVRNIVKIYSGINSHYKKHDTWLGWLLIALLIISGMPSISLSQDNLRTVPDPDPLFELETLKVADGFEVNLFAAEPMLVKPIQMNWDEDGRLWVVGSKSYPQLKPGEVPNDKVYVLEDTTGDGRADVSTVFAEGLNIPTAVLPGDGGVYVANSTEILHLKDLNGDGKADQRRTVLSGFGTGDTHHLLHTFRWGPAGKLYFNQSIYIHSRIETPHGVKELEGGGVWQLNPETLELDIFSRGLINAWGLQFNKSGQAFLTDGAGREGINYSFPGATFTSAPGAERILQGLNPGQPKHAGLDIISGSHFPDSLAGSFVTNDFRANRINRFKLEEQGSGYVSKQVGDLLWSDNVAFRPVDISVGPDGAIYVADWYNPIIQHGEVDFRDPRRDQKHGRIWRITAKNESVVQKPRFSKANTIELLNALKKPENWTRSQAKRILKEKGAEEVVPVLREWVENLEKNNKDYEHHLLEALWVFQSIDVINERLLKLIVNAENSNVRAAGIRILNYWYDEIDDARSLVKNAVGDENPHVRREAVIALRNDKTSEAASIALSALELPMDRFLDFALWQTVSELEPYWLSQVKNDSNYFGESTKTVYALKSVEDTEAAELLLSLYLEGKVPERYQEDVYKSISKWGSKDDLGTVLNLALNAKKNNSEKIKSYLTLLEDAVRQQDRKPINGLDEVVKLIDLKNNDIAEIATRLIGHWNLDNYNGKLFNLAKNKNEKIREAALDALALMGVDESLNLIVNLAGSSNSASLRLSAVNRLVSLNTEKAATIAVNIMQEASDNLHTEDLFTAFLSQEDGVKFLADELMNNKIPKEIASVGRKAMQQQIPMHRRENEDVLSLQKGLEESGGKLPPENMPQNLNDEELNRLELDVKASADPFNGEKVFRKLQCGSCHAIGGAGGLIGPDISSLGANAPTDYIIDGLLKPNADIKDGYELNRVVRSDGSELMGYLVRETSTELILRDVEGNEKSIPTKDIEKHETIPGSLMPPGLTSSLEREEFIDLVGYLSKLGETGEFRIPNERFIRNWKKLSNNKQVVTSIEEEGFGFVLKNDNEIQWEPAYSEVSGNLPVEELPVLELTDEKRYSFVTFEIEALNAGNILLSLNSIEGVKAWVGKEPLEVDSEDFQANIPEGVNKFMLLIDRNIKNEGNINVRLKEAEQERAQAKLIL